eukprot:1646751-Prymnesium_polylepis.1
MGAGCDVAPRLRIVRSHPGHGSSRNRATASELTLGQADRCRHAVRVAREQHQLALHGEELERAVELATNIQVVHVTTGRGVAAVAWQNSRGWLLHQARAPAQRSEAHRGEEERERRAAQGHSEGCVSMPFMHMQRDFVNMRVAVEIGNMGPGPGAGGPGVLAGEH